MNLFIAECFFSVAAWLSWCPCGLNVRKSFILLQDDVSPDIRLHLRQIAYHHIKTVGLSHFFPMSSREPKISEEDAEFVFFTERFKEKQSSELTREESKNGSNLPQAETIYEGVTQDKEGMALPGGTVINRRQLLDIYQLPYQARVDHKAFWTDVMQKLKQERENVASRGEDIPIEELTENGYKGVQTQAQFRAQQNHSLPPSSLSYSPFLYRFLYTVAKYFPSLWIFVAITEMWLLGCVQKTSPVLYAELQNVAYINKPCPPLSNVLYVILGLVLCHISGQLCSSKQPTSNSSNVAVALPISKKSGVCDFANEFFTVIFPQICLVSVSTRLLPSLLSGLPCFSIFIWSGRRFYAKGWKGPDLKFPWLHKSDIPHTDNKT